MNKTITKPKGEIRIKSLTETSLNKKIALLSITLSWSANFATKTLSYDSEIGSQDIITSVKKPLLTIYPSGLPLFQATGETVAKGKTMKFT